MTTIAELTLQNLFYEGYGKLFISIERLPNGTFWGTIFVEDRDENQLCMS